MTIADLRRDPEIAALFDRAAAMILAWVGAWRDFEADPLAQILAQASIERMDALNLAVAERRRR
jgi:hypothetical protein